jgi:hypothetical protein
MLTKGEVKGIFPAEESVLPILKCGRDLTTNPRHVSPGVVSEWDEISKGKTWMIEGSESACERSAERKSEELMGAGNVPAYVAVGRGRRFKSSNKIIPGKRRRDVEYLPSTPLATCTMSTGRDVGAAPKVDAQSEKSATHFPLSSR